MGLLDQLRGSIVKLIQGGDGKPPPGLAFANIWPNWEVNSPQWKTPNARMLAQMGYRRDELVFACIDYRAQTISEPSLRMYTGNKKDKKEIGGLFDAFPNKRPNTEMGEMEFWQATEIYRLIAGEAIWEIEFNRLGEPINLWPLNPAYCSYLRGPQQPIRAVRYEYPGLEPVDILRERLVIFQEFDPIYPMFKGLSRTAVALKSINVHTSTTDFLDIFFKRGANVTGYLKFAQSIDNKEAERARERWKESHGGAANWAENNIAVLGQGAEYVETQMNMRNMAFDVVDGRTESLICMAFGISPLLIEARVGLGAVTDTNFTTVEEKYYGRVAKPTWRWYSSEMTQQLLPYLNETPDVFCEFDTSDVAALQADEDALWTRYTASAEKNLIYRDEWRSAVGLEPIDSGEKVFIGVQVSPADAPTSPITNLESDFAAQQAQIEQDKARQHEVALANIEKVNNATATQPMPFGEQTETEEIGEDIEELKRWRAMALYSYRWKTTMPTFSDDINRALASVKSASDIRNVFESAIVSKRQSTTETGIVRALLEAVKAAKDLMALETSPAIVQAQPQPQMVMQFPGASFNIEQAEISHAIKAADMPAIIVQNVVEPTPIMIDNHPAHVEVKIEPTPITVNVSPTPINITNENYIQKATKPRRVAVVDSQGNPRFEIVEKGE